MYLFIDTSTNLKIALISDQLKFINLESYNTTLTSIFHSTVYSFLKKHNLELEKLSGIISISGPGSYTGMRLSEGFTQILKLKNMKIFNFYYYEIPKYLNVKNGLYITDAFKGEFFIHAWGDHNFEKVIPYDQIEYYLKGYSEVWYSSIQKLDLIKDKVNLLNVFDEFYKNPEGILLPIIKNNVERTINYFRLAEVEFKTSEK
jgi:tRNA threonylcarbamoyladenosine biosynthesis protein TsaB